MALKYRGAARAGVAALAFPWVAIVACTAVSPLPVSSVDGGVLQVDASTYAPDTAPPPNDSSAYGPDTSTTCAPASVQGYVPQWTPPRSPAAACTADQIAAYAACINASDPVSCESAADASVGSACKTCLADSKSTDPAWGPIVDVGTTGSDRQLNVAGCMAILSHDTGSGCAGSVQALQECEAAACADNCEGASSDFLNACTAQADGAGCANYVTPAACIDDAGTAVQTCFGAAGATFAQKFAAVATVFCLQTDGG